MKEFLFIVFITSFLYLLVWFFFKEKKSINSIQSKPKQIEEPRNLNYRLSYEGSQLQFAQEEINTLRVENFRLKEENELLKKLNNPYNNLKRHENDEFIDETTPVESTRKLKVYYQNPKPKQE